MKQFVEFTNPGDGGPVKLEVAVYAERVDNALLDQLVEKGFELTHVDADSVRAIKTADYDVVMTTMKELTDLGFKWNE